jgi:outer membrane protein OmpA-like peptidoglycan-associated protein
MSAMSKRVMWTFSFVVLAAGAISLAGTGVVDAQEARSPEQIIRALKPAPKTRGLSTSPAETSGAVEEKKFIDGLRGRQTRSLSTDERDKITTISQKKPNIDLEINFEYNSAKIASSAMPQVTALGQALSSADLKGSTFVVAGHTDGKGTDTYNQSLSERRADAVKRYLMEKYRVDESNLVTVGYGKSQLKDSSNPLASENRRVQVINMAN